MFPQALLNEVEKWRRKKSFKKNPQEGKED